MNSSVLNKFYLITIPIIIGVLAGFTLYLSDNDEQKEMDSNVLTKSTLTNGGSPILGNPDAPITIVEFGDYQCTFCYRFHKSSLDIIDEEYIESGKVNLVFRDFPLNGPDSVLAAEASYCAKDQGKYWQYHNQLYNNWAGERTGWITKDSLNKFAKNVDLNLNEFNSCLESHKYQDVVLASYKFAQEIGIDATPSFLIFNDERVIKIKGNQPLQSFVNAISGL